MAGTTGLEPATSAVTAKRKVVTYRKQASRMASFGAVRNDREPISNPYQTHYLCPVDLCPSVENRVAQMLARASRLRKRAATPCPWSRWRRAGFATIHRRTWRPAIAGRLPVFRDQSPPFESRLEPSRSLLHRVEEFRPACHDQQRPEESSQVWCRSCLARQERQYRERQKPSGPWFRYWQTRASGAARQSWPNAASDRRPGYRGRPYRSADR